MTDNEGTGGHTPGPWKPVADMRRINRWRVDSCDDQSWVADIVQAVRGDFKECRANARLIAAAPTLLAELKRAVGFWDPTGCDGDFDAARAAITAATGETL